MARSTHAQAAAIIRGTLKRMGIKARVTSSIFSMGSSVDVRVQQDVLPEVLESIKAYVAEFTYGTFDGMTDMYEYTNRCEDLPQVKYVHVWVEV